VSGRDYSSWLLAAGALVGVALAAVGLGSGGATAQVPAGAVAVVDGAPIDEVDYRRALAAVAADRRVGVLDETLRRRVLERLIDEELLVQRAVELQLAERDSRVRNYLSAAVIDLIVARADDAAAEPGELELSALYAADPGFFAIPAQWRVEVALFGNADAARAAHERLAAGAGFADIRALSEPLPAPLPNARLPAAKLREYLGPAVTRAVAELAVGEVSAPLPTPAGHYLVHVVERIPGAVPAFEDVRELVGGEYRRRAGDARLRAFLAERRAAASITVAGERL